MALPKIDLPIYETELISLNKKVRFRPFLVKEQKLFLMAAQSDEFQDTVKSIKQVLKNCVLDELDVDSLPLFELEHLFLQLRARSVGEVVSLRYTCNNDVKGEGENETKKCGGVVKIDINLLNIHPSKKENHNKVIQLTEKLGVTMRYPSFSILENLKIESESDLIKLVVACIDNIYDEDQVYYAKDASEEELIEFVDNLQQADIQKIQEFFLTMPKLEKSVDFDCPKCGYHEEINVEGIQNFFV
jgi:hypothetical protein